MQIRRGREFYGKKYEEAVSLYSQGKSAKEIAQSLGISYSAAYHWVKGIRKPCPGNVNDFIAFLESNGPSAAIHVMQKFPKHNEIFLIASRRGLPVNRVFLGKKYRELSMWYYLSGQGDALKKRIDDIQKKIDDLKNRLKSSDDK
jgi:hypothetical protein